MYWPKAEDLRRLPTPDWLFDACEESIEPDARVSGDPQVLMVMTPRDVELEGKIWSHPIALLVTPILVVAARKRALGNREVQSWFRWDIPRYGVGLWRGAGPGYAVTMEHGAQGRFSFVFETPDEAESLGRYWASG